MSDTMRVTVMFFAGARERAGTGRIIIELEPESTLGETVGQSFGIRRGVKPCCRQA